MKNLIQIEGLTQSDLRELITEVITEVISTNIPKNKPGVSPFLTREETAKLLRISLPTLSQLTTDGTLKGYRIGRRVLYKHHEVEEALSEIDDRLYNRF